MLQNLEYFFDQNISLPWQMYVILLRLVQKGNYYNRCFYVHYPMPFGNPNKKNAGFQILYTFVGFCPDLVHDDKTHSTKMVQLKKNRSLDSPQALFDTFIYSRPFDTIMNN